MPVGAFGAPIQVTQASSTPSLDDLQFANFHPWQGAGSSAIPQIIEPQTTAERALRAVEDLTGWLSTTEENIADLAGFSRRSTTNWRAGRNAYPKTVRALFETHALVSSLVAALGTTDAAIWFQQPDETGRRVDALADAGGRRRLMSAAQPLLFRSAPRDRQADADFFETEDTRLPSRQNAFTDVRAPRRQV